MDLQRYLEIEYRHTMGRDFRAEDCLHLLHDDSHGERASRRPSAGAAALVAAAAIVLWVLLPATPQPAEAAQTIGEARDAPASQAGPQSSHGA
jgi:ferric-dicitrate binding protein FerR (iron transport regulator)